MPKKGKAAADHSGVGVSEAPPLVEPLPYVLANRIRRDIIHGVFPPGTALREESLEAQHGASRGPVREALRLLQARGLVTHLPRRGYRVRTHTDAEVIDLYRMRARLERQAVEELERVDSGLLCEILERENTLMREAQRRADIDRYLQHNIQFHRSIRDQGGNSTLQRVLEAVTEVSEPVRYGLLIRHLDRSRACTHHQQMIALIAQGRFDVAGVLSELHVLESLPMLLSFRSEVALSGRNVDNSSAKR